MSRLNINLQARIKGREITPTQAFAMQADLDAGRVTTPILRSDFSLLHSPMSCDQARAAVEAARSDIEANGPDALRDLLHQTDALLARMTHWTKCQRAARYRALLASHQASREGRPGGTIDLVVPLGTGSKHGDIELKYLLRSALAHFKSLRLIHIIGPKRPAWLADHPMIRWHQWKTIKPKNHDIVAKFIHAANHPDVAETFIGTCDDFLFLAPPPEGYGAVCRPRPLPESGKSYWPRAQAQTRRLLDAAGFPHLFYDYHAPTVMTKAGWRKVDREIPWRSLPGHAVWSLYHNVAGVHGTVVSKGPAGYHRANGSAQPPSPEAAARATAGRTFLCYNDGGLKGGVLQAWLEARLPSAAPWEKAAALRSPPEGSRRNPPSYMAARRWSAANDPGALAAHDTALRGLLAPRQRLALCERFRRDSRAPSEPSPPRHPDPPGHPGAARSGGPGLADLDVLTVLYGRSAPRAKAVAATFARWNKHQSPMPRVTAAWCYAEGEEPEDLKGVGDKYPWLHLVRLPQYDLDDGVFRKEGLLNLLIREHSEAPYILTIDADVWSKRPGWFKRIRDKLAEHPDNVLQCYGSFHDTAERMGGTAWCVRSLGAKRRGRHPGLGWAFTRAWVDKHRGRPVFNPLNVAGSGDCCFAWEHFHRTRYKYTSRYTSWPFFKNIWRKDLPKGRLACVDEAVLHQNHTNRELVPDAYKGKAFADRAYYWSRWSLNIWGDPSQYVRLDESGVPLLRSSAGPFARWLKRKPEMQTEADARRIIAESLFGAHGRGDTLPHGRLDSLLDDRIALSTLEGIGDHVMLLGLVNRLHRDFPDMKISVQLTRAGLEPWFRQVCPDVKFAGKGARKVMWRHAGVDPGQHALEMYGASPEDIVLAPKGFDAPCVQAVRNAPGPRIAFVTETGGPHLARKQWPHWQRLADMVRERYGVEPFWIGTQTKADPIHTLPALLASMDAVVTVEGMASHLCWAIRKPAVVLVTGALEPTALCYPGFHTILRGTCPFRRFCNCYMRPNETEPECVVECMSSISPEAVLEHISPRPRIVNVHFLAPNKRHGGRINAGDFNAGAARYFPGMEERASSEPAVPCDIAVFGGGGVYQEYMLRKAREYAALGSRIVIWGAGIVTEDREKGMTPFNWREFGDIADLCGLREPSPWEFVPCSSCMSPLFDELAGTPPAHDVVYYNHPDKPVREGQPRMTNYDTTDLETVLRFLASGRKVVTSSYHGRIWATWLGREVELDGFAAPMLAQSGEIPPLEEARRLNREFHSRVLKVTGLVL